MQRIETWGLGRVLAIIGIVLVVVLFSLGHLPAIPQALLFALAFAAILL